MKSGLLKRSISLILAIVLLLSVVPPTAVFAADTPSVKIVSFTRGEQTDLRSSELLEARVEGYDGNVQELTYEWSNGLGTYLYVYNSHNMYGINDTAGEVEIDEDESYSGVGYAWASVYGYEVTGNTALDGTVTVKVKDSSGKVICSDSHTGTVTVSGSFFNRKYTYSGFVPANLDSDMKNVTIGIFEGDERNIKDLLGESAIVHITCRESTVSDGKIVSGSDHISLTEKSGDYYITGIKAGESTDTTGDAQISMSIEKGYCKFHTYSSGTATTTVFVFKKPTTSTTATTLILTGDLDERCEYFIEGRTGEKQADGTIVFTGLNPNTEYQVEVRGKYQDADGNTQYAYAYVYDTTKPVYTATVYTYLDGTLTDVNNIHGGDTTLYLKQDIDYAEYITLTKTATGTYTATINTGTYYAWHKDGDHYHQIDNHQLLIQNASSELHIHHYSVTYDLAGGAFADGKSRDDNYYSGKPVVATDAVPEKEGYVFTGWKYSDQIYKSGDQVTNSIAAPITLTAQWEKTVNVTINVTIDHRSGDGYDTDGTKDELTVNFLEKTKDSAAFLETGEVLHFASTGVTNGKGAAMPYTYTPTYADGEIQIEDTVRVSTYTATAATYEDRLSTSQFGVAVAKSSYDVGTITKTQDKDGNWTIHIPLTYNPSSFDLAFSVEMAEDVPKELYPKAVIAKIACWIEETQQWEIITQMEGSKPGVRVDIDPETGKGSGSYPAWKYEQDGVTPWGNRMVIASYIYDDTTVVTATENISGTTVTYADGNFTGTMGDVSDGKLFGANLYGAYYDDATGGQKGTLHAVISVEKYDVTFDAQGGTVNGQGKQTVKNQYYIPAFAGYQPVRENYEFKGWYLDAQCTRAATEKVLLTADVTLYAKWNAIQTLTGVVTVAGTYVLDGEVITVWPADRAAQVTVALQEITAEGIYTVGSQVVGVTWDETTKLGTSAQYVFGNLDGSKSYRISVVTTNYSSTYQNETTAATDDGNPVNDYNTADYTAVFEKDPTKTFVNAYQQFQPDAYFQPVKVDASAIGTGFRPSEVLVDYMGKLFGASDSTYNVISQHAVSPYGIPVKMNSDGISSGNDGEHLWKEMWNGTLYVYQARLKNITANGRTIEYGDDAPYTVRYGNVAGYDTQTETASGVLSVTLTPKTYKVYFNLNTGDPVTGMDEYRINDGEYVQEYVWSYGTDITAAPVRTGYTFLGWTDGTSSDYVTKIAPDKHEDITLKAAWEKDESQTKSVSYTVQHVVDSQLMAQDTETFTADIWINAEEELEVQAGSLDPNDYAGYKLDSITPDVQVGSVVDNGAVITLNYVKDDGQTKNAKYTVQHVVDGKVKDTADHTVEVWVNDTTVIIRPGTISPNSYTGYRFDGISPNVMEGSAVAFDSVITLNYIPDSTQTKEVKYTVKHVVEGVALDTYVFTEEVWVNDNSGITIENNTLLPKEYEGFKHVSTDPDGLTEGEKVADGTVITLTYAKDDSQTKVLTYKVRHVVAGTEMDVKNYTETVWVKAPDEITVQSGSIDARNYVGYKLDTIDPDVKVGERVANNAVITLTYVKDESQTKSVRYIVEHKVGDEIRYSQTYTDTVWIHDEDSMITVAAGSLAQPEYLGYVYDNTSPDVKEGDAVATGTTITLTYIKDETQKKAVNYTVQHVAGGVVRDTHTYTGEVWVNAASQIQIREGTLAQNTYIGYTYDRMESDTGVEKIEVGETIPSGTTIQIIYEKDDSQTKKLTYIVRHNVAGELRNIVVNEETVWVNAENTIQVKSGTLAPYNFVGYKYDHMDPVTEEGALVNDATIITLYYVKDETQKKDVNYTVQHVANGNILATHTYTDKVWTLDESKIRIQEGSLDQKTIEGYRYSGISHTLNVGDAVDSGTVITLVYVADTSVTKPVNYVVEHNVDGVIHDSQTYHGTVWIHADRKIIVTAESIAQKTYPGYAYSGITPNVSAGDAVDSGSVIVLNYVKDTTQTKNVSYTVQHMVGTEVKDSKTYSATVWVNDDPLIAVDLANLAQNEYEGYLYQNISHSLQAGQKVADGTVITLYYAKNEDDTKTVSYTVQHKVDGAVKYERTYTEIVWVNTDTVNIVDGSLTVRTYTGYKHVRTDNEPAGNTVADGTVIVLVYEKDNYQTHDISYTVKYVAGNTILNTYTYTDTVWINETNLKIKDGTIDPKTYPGYSYVGVSHPDLKAGDLVANGTEIVHSYEADTTQTKELAYTVRHDVAGTIKNSKTYTKNVWINDPNTIVIESDTLAPNSYLGYKFDSIDTTAKENDAVDSGTVITLTYVKDESQTKDVNYTVQHVVRHDGTSEVRDTKTYIDKIWVNEPVSTIVVTAESLAQQSFIGYKYSSIENDAGLEKVEANTVVPSGTVVTLVYEKDASQTKELAYTVRHETDGTIRDSATYKETVWINAPSNITVVADSLNQKTYVGYTYDSMEPQAEVGKMVADGQVIVLKYVKDESQTKTLSYAVAHNVDGQIVDRNVFTKDVWVNDSNELPVVEGSLNEKTYNGYKYVRTENAPSGTTVPTGTIITLFYEKDDGQKKTVSYTVQHKVDGVVRDTEKFTSEVWVHDEAVIEVQENSLNSKTYEGYKFSSMTPDDVAVGSKIASGSVFVLEYVKDSSQTKTLTYTVQHVVDGAVKDTATYTDNTIWIHDNSGIAVDPANLAQKTYQGYRFSFISHTLGDDHKVPDGTVITLTYVKDDSQTKTVSYTVYHKIGSQVMDHENYTGTVWIHDEAKIAIRPGSLDPKSYTGYKFDSIAPTCAVGDVIADKSEIVITYVKDDSQTKTLSYTVEHVVDGKVKDTQAYSDSSVWINAEDTIQVGTGVLEQKTYIGYKFSGITPEVQEGDSVPTGTVITLTYEKDETQQKEVGYYVHHNVAGVVRDTEMFSDLIWVNDANALTIQEGTFDQNHYVGYQYSHTDSELKVGDTIEHGAIITLFYVHDDSQTKTLRYTVEHNVDGVVKESKTYTTNVWINSEELIAIQNGTVAVKNYPGYRFSNISQAVVDGQHVANNTVITLYYVKDSFQYTVEYYYDGVMNADKTETATAHYHDVISTYPDKAVEGFTLDSVVGLPLTISENASQNLIKVYYATDVVVDADQTDDPDDTDKPYDPSNPGGGDEIPDRYQVTIKYVVNPEHMGTVTLKEEVLTLFDRNGWTTSAKVAISGSVAVAGTDYAFLKWTDEAGNVVGDALKLGALELDAVGGETYVFTANMTPTPKPIEPAAAAYRVEHYKWNAETQKYELADEEMLVGEIGSSVKAQEKHYEGYAIDPYAQGAAPSGVVTLPVAINGEITNLLVLKLFYDVDVIEDSELEPDTEPGDDIPDKYQKKVIFRVINGIWAPVARATGSSEDIVVYVTLLDANGNWSKNGSASLTAPTGMQPNAGYQGGAWDEVPPTTVSGTHTETFIYRFVKKPSSSPETGDNSAIAFWFALMTLSTVGMAALIVSQSKLSFDDKRRK